MRAVNTRKQRALLPSNVKKFAMLPVWRLAAKNIVKGV